MINSTIKFLDWPSETPPSVEEGVNCIYKTPNGALWIADENGPRMLTNYAIGDIYITSNQNSPAAMFGGSWEQIQGAVLSAVGIGSDQNGVTKNIVPGLNQGEWQHSQTIEELAVHNHRLQGSAYGSGGNTDMYFNQASPSERNWHSDDAIATEGSGAPANISNPMYGIYVWRKIA